MAPPKWATEEQTAFLKGEDEKWSIIKAGESTLKGFYARTTLTFLTKWPAKPDEKLLAKANGDVTLATELAQGQVLKVCGIIYAILTPSDLLLVAHRGLV